MKSVFNFFILFVTLFSASAAEKVIEATGNLSYQTTADFFSQWIPIVKAPAGNERRMFPAKAPDGTVALCCGRYGKNQVPLARFVFGDEKNETVALFDVSGAGEQNAFTAQVDFLYHRQHRRPLERIEITLGVMSADQKRIYNASIYTNSDIWNKNYLKVMNIDTANPKAKPKAILWKDAGTKMEKGAWYRLKFSMVRMNETSRSPVILKLALYEINGKKAGGADGKVLAEASSKIMPNLGDKVKFIIQEPAIPPYIVYITNISASSGAKKKSLTADVKPAGKVFRSSAQSVAGFRKYLMDRKNSYKKGKETVILSRNGTAEFVIVQPADASNPVRFAAQELKQHLDKITGANFQIVSKVPAGKKGIFLGDTPEAVKAGINVKEIARDGYRIIAKPDKIIIAGFDENNVKSEVLFNFMNPENERKYSVFSPSAWNFQRGSLYGAYRFLEELGVRWFMPGEDGTVIPENRNLSFTAFDTLEEPVFDGRSGAQDGRFFRPNRDAERTHLYRNVLKWSYRENFLWVLRMRRATAFYPLNHHPPSNQYEERFGKTHSEYFALYNGKRSLQREVGSGRTGALCYGDPGLFREVMRDIMAYANGVHASKRGYLLTDTQNYNMCENNGWPETHFGNFSSLLPHDLYQPCGCKICSPFLSARQDGQMSDIVWPFIAKVGNELLKRKPGHIITCLAYSSYAELPMTLDKLPDNVMIGILPSKDLMNQPYALAKPERFKAYFKLTEEWNRMNNMPLAFWIHWLYRSFEPKKHAGVPMILPEFTAKYFRETAKYGRIMYIEMDTDNFVMEHLNRYLFMKLLLNPFQDPRALVDDYAEKMYGPAGAIFKEIFADIERRCFQIASTDAVPAAIWKDKDKFSPETLVNYRKMVTEAEKLTNGTRYSKAVQLFSRYFLGVMEKSSKEYLRTGNADQKRMAMIKKADQNKVIDLRNGKSAAKEFIPLYGYEDFQTAEAVFSCKSGILKIHLVGKEKNPGKLLANVKKNGTPAVWNDDCYEIMLVNPTGTDYVQIIVNSLGTYYIKPFHRMPLGNYKIKVNGNVAPEIGNWTLDLEIPLAQFNPDRLKGNWKVNVFRNRRTGDPKAYQASGLYLKELHFHKLEQYFTLIID